MEERHDLPWTRRYIGKNECRGKNFPRDRIWVFREVGGTKVKRCGQGEIVRA